MSKFAWNFTTQVCTNIEIYRRHKFLPTSYPFTSFCYMEIWYRLLTWTDFNNFWYTESWGNITPKVVNLSTLPEICHRTTLWNTKFFKYIIGFRVFWLSSIKWTRCQSAAEIITVYLFSRLLLPAYDVTEVSEEKARATTDGSESVKSPWAFQGTVGQIFRALSRVHFFVVRKTV